MGRVPCKIDESLEVELRRIQENINKQIGNVSLSKPQASIVAAKILRESPTKIKAEIVRAKRGRRVRGIYFV